MTIAGYTFKDTSLLETALTHKSYANERRGTPHNERLEFLGDAVLGFIAAEYLFDENPTKPEGELTKLRAGYVCEKSLASAARRLGFGERIRLGRGEKAEGGGRDSILADAFEAVLAAICLDGGLEPCRALVKESLLNRPPAGSVQDAKSLLQEVLQSRGKPGPEYRAVSESGPDHRKSFIVEVLVEGRSAAQGEGRSKKAAEMAAAERALLDITQFL